VALLISLFCIRDVYMYTYVLFGAAKFNSSVLKLNVASNVTVHHFANGEVASATEITRSRAAFYRLVAPKLELFAKLPYLHEL